MFLPIFQVPLFLIPYFTSPWLFCNYQFVHPNPFISLTQHPLTSAVFSLFSVSTSLFLFCLFCSLEPTYEWSHMTFVFNFTALSWYCSSAYFPYFIILNSLDASDFVDMKATSLLRASSSSACSVRLGEERILQSGPGLFALILGMSVKCTGAVLLFPLNLTS